MSGPQPPRRRRIAGENKPGVAPAKPQARKAAPARPVVPTPKPAPTRRERENAKNAEWPLCSLRSPRFNVFEGLD